jgi:hypothetical protein
MHAGLRHELNLSITPDPKNAAHWISRRITDANHGAMSESLTPGIGRGVNANERASTQYPFY